MAYSTQRAINCSRCLKHWGNYKGYFRRGNLYAYAGVAKRGKSRWLAQTAAVASLNRCKVFYISLEMDEIETDDLLLNTFIRSPLNKEASEPIEVTIPRFSEENTILYDTVQMNPLQRRCTTSIKRN